MQVGLVCFRLFGSNQLNQKLLTTINASGKLHMVTMVIMAKIAYCVLIFRCQQVSMTISSSGSVSALSLLLRRILVSAEVKAPFLQYSNICITLGDKYDRYLLHCFHDILPLVFINIMSYVHWTKHVLLSYLAFAVLLFCSFI